MSKMPQKDITSSLFRALISEEFEPFPFLESFAREYSQKVSEDKKTPLFSKTSKYNSFPVRCQWKSDKSGERKKKKDGRGDEDREMRSAENRDNVWRKENLESNIEPTKLKKASGFLSSVLRVLNKITEDNFDSQIKELLKVLNEKKDPKAVKMIANIILEKVWYDKSFYNIYVSLCQKLWENNEWSSESYKIFSSTTSDVLMYFYVLQIDPLPDNAKAPALNGPYKTQEEAEIAAKQCVHLRTIFLALCRDHFHQREKYITESNKLGDCNERYKLRRKLFGTVEIVGQFYKMGYLKESVIHYIFLSLLHSDHNKQDGAKFEEEIEAFHLLWNVAKSKLPNHIFKEYRPLLEKEKMSNKWSSRTSFMIDDMVESMRCRFLPKRVIPLKKEANIQPKQLDNSKTDMLFDERELIEKTLKLSRSGNGAIEMITENVKVHKYNDRSGCITNITTSLLKDSTEYGEYLPAHLKTILALLKTEGSGLTFSQLSEAFSSASEDISDLKIDAPKAPDNFAILLSSILQTNEDDVLQISISPTDTNLPNLEIEEFENGQLIEWKNIIKLSSKHIGIDVSSRVTLFSMNGTAV